MSFDSKINILILNHFFTPTYVWIASILSHDSIASGDWKTEENILWPKKKIGDCFKKYYSVQRQVAEFHILDKIRAKTFLHLYFYVIIFIFEMI